MKVLLATDGSKNAVWACEMVTHLPDPAGIEARLVHVTIPLPEPAVPFPDVFMEEDLLLRERIEKEHEMRAGDRLDECRRMLPAGMAVQTEHRVGEPAAEILEAIREHDIELAILGARGVDEAPMWALGSVSQKVARYAPCPVLIAREDATRLRRALVALDHGEHAQQTVAFLARAKWLSGCRFTLAHVVEDRYLRESRIAASQFSGSEAYLAKLQEALFQDAQTFLGQHAGQLEDAGMTVDTMALEGDPAAVIKERAETGGFDLVVVGSKGRHGLGHFLMGSTSQKLLRTTHRSVLLVRTGT